MHDDHCGDRLFRMHQRPGEVTLPLRNSTSSIAGNIWAQHVPETTAPKTSDAIRIKWVMYVDVSLDAPIRIENPYRSREHCRQHLP